MHRGAIASLAAAALLFAADPAAARDLVYGSWVSPKHNVMTDVLPPYFDAVKKATNGAITWKIVAGGQLVNGRTTLSGLRDGLVDAGLGIPPYAPTDVPMTNAIFITLDFSGDAVAATGASVEMVMLHCPGCIKEMKKNNVVFLGGYSVTPYYVMCRMPVSSVADLAGKKVRATGAYINFLKLTEATPVSMGTVEAVESLQRGALDCSVGSIAWLKTYGFQDVTKHVVGKALGMNTPALMLLLNRDTWNGMTEEQKRAHLRYAPLANARATILAYIDLDDAILAEAKAKHGVVVHKPADDWNDLIARYKEEQIKLNSAFAASRGIKNARPLLEEYVKLGEKWRRISKDVGHDVNKFAAAMQREIYDKIDLDDL